ncbi:MAG: hypothetical protein D6759_05400 [Chloroflexi bacterium]|nr:MAG: hypothetical protein D6759_05400 [Chloroflexota bacterium]
MRWVRGAIALLFLLPLLTVATPTAAQEPRRGVLRGRVLAVEGTTVQVQTRREEVTLLTDEETRFRLVGRPEADLQDLKPGMGLLAQGTWEEEGRFRARRVIARPPRPLRLQGRVASIEEDAFTLETRRGTVTVTVGQATEFLIPGAATPGLTDLPPGAQVLVQGYREGERTVRARQVALVRDDEGRRGAIRGRLVAVEGDTLRLQLQWVELRFQTDEQTRLRLWGIESPSLADLTPGQVLLVQGYQDDEGVLRATAILGRAKR